jgi:GAF domain-containing protein/CheY-like chemotaxis protein
VPESDTGRQPEAPDAGSTGERRPTEAQTLLAVSEAVGSTLELREVVRRATRALVRAVGADAGGAWGLSPDQRDLLPLAGYRVPKELAQSLAAGTIPARHPLMETAKALAGPVYASDSRRDGRFDYPLFNDLPHRSVLLQPMWLKREIVGCFAVVWLREPHAFTRDELRLSDGIARQAAIAVANARLYEETERRRREAEVLADIARTINASLDVDTVLQRVAEAARELCASDMGRIGLWDAAAGAVVMRYRVGARSETDAELRIEPSKGVGGIVLVTGRPFRTDDYANDSRITGDYMAYARQASIVAEIVVPIRIGDRVEGLLYADNVSPRPFTDWDEAVLLRLADQAAVAIQNGRLYAQAEQRRRTAESLSEIGRLVSRSLDPDEVQQRIADSVRRMLGAARATLLRMDPVTGALNVVAVSGAGPSPVGLGTVFPPGTGAVGLAVREDRLVTTPDFLADPALTYPPPVRAELERAPNRAVVAVPLTVGSRAIGVLSVTDRAGRIFDAEAARLLQAFADQAAIALENARLYAETTRLLGDYQRKVEELSVLYELSRAVTGQLDVGRLVQTVHEQVGRVLDARHMAVVLFDASRGEFEVALRMNGDRVDPNPVRRYPLGVGLVSRVVVQRQPIRTDDYAAACRRHGVEPLWTSHTLHHWLGVPMIAGDAVVGVLVLRSPGRPFSDADERLLTNIAGLAGLAVQSAGLYAEKTRAYDELSRTQDQLAQAQKMEAIGRLAGGVAHDFNNLLTVIKGRSQLVLHRLGPDDPLRRQVALVEETAERAASLTRQLLAFSRKQVLEAQVLDLNAVVEGIEKMLRRLIGEDIELRVRLWPAVWAVRADPGQLEQVIVNLVVNARDAMPGGGVLTLETANVERPSSAAPADTPPGACVRLSVSDTGVGMSPGTQARLFEPFFTTKEVGKGTGLGLATVYGIIKQSGGSIAVRSAPGSGTTFDILLPGVEGAVDAPRPGRPLGEEPGGGETILLVEDEDSVRDLAREILEGRGYTVLEARDGSQALEISEAHAGAIALLLTDVVMPGMSGPQLADRITARRPAVRVLYVSGYTDRAIVTGDGPPAAALLHKPFSPGVLAGKVREALDGRR